MPSPKTECTELSVGFGILGIENFLELQQSQVEKFFEGTLSKNKYAKFRGNLKMMKCCIGKCTTWALA